MPAPPASASPIPPQLTPVPAAGLDVAAVAAALRLDRERLAALYTLSQMADAPEQALKDFALEASLRVTGSRLGYLYFMDEAEQTLTLHAWSREVMAACTMAEKPTVYRVQDMGLWGEAVRLRRPVVTNDYAAPHPAKRGVPAGHVPIVRHLNLPVLDGDRIVLVAGVGNKGEDYDENDVRSLTLVMDALWRQLQRRRLADHLARAQRLESLAQLAGGIAHDFNNLLTGVLASVSFARRRGGDVEAGDALREAEEAARRAQALTRQLLTFARGGAPRRRIVALGPVVEAAARLPVRGTAATLELDLDPALHPADVDPDQVAQLVNNLVLNSVQAMPSGGRVRVVARNSTVAAGDPLGLAPGPYVRVAVEDDGPGIPAEVGRRIFEPYFTTKPGGSGLGLAVCESVARRHGGAIAVEPPPVRGCRVVALLPAAPGAEPERREAPRPPVAAPPTTVLVVDDEPSILRAARRCLGAAGIEVATAQTVDAGVEAWRTAGGRFDAVVTDLTMPGSGGGVELLARLRAEGARVPVLISSGYSERPAIADPAGHGFAGFLAKPYAAEDLVRAVLAAARGG